MFILTSNCLFSSLRSCQGCRAAGSLVLLRAGELSQWHTTPHHPRCTGAAGYILPFAQHERSHREDFMSFNECTHDSFTEDVCVFALRGARGCMELKLAWFFRDCCLQEYTQLLRWHFESLYELNIYYLLDPNGFFFLAFALEQTVFHPTTGFNKWM